MYLNNDFLIFVKMYKFYLNKTFLYLNTPNKVPER
jgi:hypothetical protein